ncbi:hypothetical protein [Corynebacterium flavescens]|uniref:hypothetical protein n=1 Tax=Corynebacterium flavescens TaxID=28028 RepID=UPI00264841DC|nr:hypothetical protein [Corynebacterium flavescens]MDN6199356.1 hypothetical protein [Corynebacterium flavescens]MDN6227413.1 hypothetical protein [Corynebacterium flavescens]
MSITIKATHTVTCENTPVEQVYRALQEKCPDLDEKLNAVELAFLRGNNQRLTCERDDIHIRLKHLLAVNERLLNENTDLSERVVNFMDEARPALPEGMRIAEHPEYGRVVVAIPRTKDTEKICATTLCAVYAEGPYVRWLPAADLTFLDSEPEPAPLPKPEDCKAGEIYLVKTKYNGKESVGIGMRNDPSNEEPWGLLADDIYHWPEDSEVTLLARLVPDREVS